MQKVECPIYFGIRKLKRGDNKAKVTFDHTRMTQASRLTLCREMLIPLMKKSKSTKLVFDCTTVYHNDAVYKLMKNAGIEVYESGGRPFDVEGGYPPNSHDCMSNELINDRLKEICKKEFDKLRKSRQK